MKATRSLHHDLYDLHSSQFVIRVFKSRRIGWAAHVARLGERRVACGVSVGKPEGRNPFVKPRRRWEDSIKVNLKGDRLDVDWIDLAQDRDVWRALVSVVMVLRVA
jgi:hypothetical protein